MKNMIIFTDLDGTLLDKTYSYDSALPALALIEQHGVPLVICSSKTSSEIKFYQMRLNNNHPFISENGGGIFIPTGYFGFNAMIPQHYQEPFSGYDVIRLGAQYADLRKALKLLQEEGFAVKGFGDMTTEEVSLAMGLTLAEAELAKQRDFDEPFFFNGTEEETENLFKSIRTRGFNVTKGKIYHLLGPSDKGRAVAIIVDLYGRKYGPVTTVGLGDSPNDVPMLGKVDIPIIVQKPDGTYDSSFMANPKIIRAKGIGPEGWNGAITELVPHLNTQM